MKNNELRKKLMKELLDLQWTSPEEAQAVIALCFNSLKAELVKRLDDIPEASMKEAHNSSVISRDEAIGLVEKI